MTISLCVLFFVLSIVCHKSNFNELFVIRIPVYMIGVIIGDKLIKKGEHFKIGRVVSVFFICVLLIVLNYIFNEYNRWWTTRLLFIPEYYGAAGPPVWTNGPLFCLISYFTIAGPVRILLP